jgi:inner membrane protein
VNPEDLGANAHWIWLAAAAVLGLAELAAPGVYLVWFAAAAALTGIATLLLGLPVGFQLALFGLFSIAAVLSGRRVYDRNPIRSDDPMLNDRAARLIGETVTVVRAIEDGIGRVKVGDSIWSARGPNSVEGTKVRIVRAEGSCLVVEPVADPHPAAIK